MTAVPEVRLANDIAAQFHYLPPADAAAAVANHMRLFWDPRMRRQLRQVLGQQPPADHLDRDLDPIAAAAALLLDA